MGGIERAKLQRDLAVPEGTVLGLAIDGRVLTYYLLFLTVLVLFLALPHLAADLDAGSTQQLWILDVYGFLLAGVLVTMGTLGDRIGRRRLLMIGATAFGLASLPR